MKKYCLVFLLIFIPLFVKAGTTAEVLLNKCESGSEYCFGYIVGFYDGRTTDDYGFNIWKSCPPTDESGMGLKVTYTQMVRVFVDWANNNPAQLHNHDWQAVRQAFAEAWPCND